MNITQYYITFTIVAFIALVVVTITDSTMHDDK